MTPNQKNNTGQQDAAGFTPANTGNASNPSPFDTDDASTGKQLLDEKAEKYIRESGTIEDMPDEQDWEEANETIKKEKKD